MTGQHFASDEPTCRGPRDNQTENSRACQTWFPHARYVVLDVLQSNDLSVNHQGVACKEGDEEWEFLGLLPMYAFPLYDALPELANGYAGSTLLA